MNTFEGVVPLEDDEVPVIVDLDDNLRLSTNGTEIGEWSEGEFYISDDGDGVYTITAENEILRFIPSEPDLFAHTVRVEGFPVGRHESPGPIKGLPVEPPAAIRSVDRTASRLSPMMRVLFLILVALTTLLGGWAAYNVFFV